MTPPAHMRLALFDDAARAELGDRVVLDLDNENVGFHWRHALAAHMVIRDAFDRAWAITRRAAWALERAAAEVAL